MSVSVFTVHLGAWLGRALELVLEDEQVVCGGDGDDALVWVPRRVEYLLVEVQAVYANLVLKLVRLRLIFVSLLSCSLQSLL